MTTQKSLDHVQPEEVRKLLEEEREILNARRQRQDELEKQFESQRSQRNKDRPEFEKALRDLEKKIDAKRKEKEALFDQSSGEGMGEIVRNLQKIQTSKAKLRNDAQRIQAELTTKDAEMKRLKDEIDALEKQLGKSRSQAEVQNQLKEVEKRIAKAEATKNDSMLKKMKTERKGLQERKQLLEEYHKKSAQLKDFNKKVEDALEQMDNNIKEAERLAEAEEKAENAKKNVKVPTKEEREERSMKIQAIKDEIDNLYKEKRNLMDNKASPEAKKISDAIDDLKKSRDGAMKRFDELKALIPTHEITTKHVGVFGMVMRPETLSEIEQDFGVVLELWRTNGGTDKEEGNVRVRGGKAKECAEAIEEMLERAAEDQKEWVTEIHADTVGEFVGQGGTKIQRFQTESGARINLDHKKDSKDPAIVRVQGSAECVEKAQEMIEEFKRHTTLAYVPFDHNVSNLVQPKLMRQWQAQYGCQLVRGTPAMGKVTIMGLKENVEKAQSEIDEFFKGVKENTVTIPMPPGVPFGAVLGRGGENVRSIEEKTRAVIDLTERRVTVMAANAKIAAEAKMLVERLIRDNTTEEAMVPFNPELFYFLTRPKYDRSTVKRPEHVDPNRSDSPNFTGPICLLEKLKQESDCLRVQALREKSKVLIVGKKGPVTKCKEMLKEALDFTKKSRKVAKANSGILYYLTDRDPQTRRAKVDFLRDVEGMDEVVVTPNKGEVVFLGEAAAVDSGMQQFKEMVDKLMKESVAIDAQDKVGRVIGPRGMVKRRLQEEFGVSISADDGQVVIFGGDDAAREMCKEEVTSLLQGDGRY